MARKRRGRSSRTREINKRIVIATEGKTERLYFDAMTADDRYSNVKFAKLTTPDPDAVIRSLDHEKRKIEQKFELNEDDEFWVVIDKDRNDLQAVSKKVRRKGYCLAESNPCFEVWLLLHYKPLEQFSGLEASGDNSACSRSERELEKLDNNYDSNNKGKWKASKYLSMRNCAIENARNADKHQRTSWLNHIGSRVYRLVESIIESSPHHPLN